MASNFPTSLDSFTDPTSGSSLASPSHSGQHIDLNDAVEKLEAKMGIGSSNASSASANAVLLANGSGSSSWSLNYPRGVVGYQELTTVFNTSATHTTYQDTGLTLTLTLSTSRLYKVTFMGNPYPSGGLQGMVFRLVYGSTPTEKIVWNLASASLEAGSSLAVTLTGYLIPASASSTTYKIQLKGSSSNTTVSDYGASTQPRQFLFEDMGLA